MKEHEDEVMPSVDKVVSESPNVEGKNLGFLTEKDQEEDVMVDVVGSDVVEDDVHGRTEANLDGNSGSEELGMQKETETCDQDMEDVAGSGEDCDASVGIRVLSSEKAEVIVNEEEVAGSGEDCDASVDRVLASEKVVIPVASGSNGDIGVTYSKERGLTEEVVKLIVESVEVVADGKIVESSVLTTNLSSQEVDMVVEEGTVEIVADGKIVESSVLTANLGSQEVDMVVEEVTVEDGVSVDPSLVCANNQSSATEMVNSRTDEVDESNKEDDCLHLTSKVTTDDAQDTIDGDCAVNEKIEKQNELLVSSKVSEPLITTNPGSEDLDLVCEHGLAGKDDEAQDEIPVDPSLATEVVNSATGNGVMGEKTGKEDEILDSAKIPESLTTVSLVLSSEDADMDRGEDAGMDIDEVRGIDVTSDAEKGQHVNVTANPEAIVQQKLLGSSSGPVLIQHREEQIKSREPIVYGRRVHVEVPLYESVDLEQKLPESSSPVSEDENLKIETDSDSEEEEDDDDDDDDDNDDEQKVDRRNSELLENGNLVSLHQSRYFKPPDNEGEFSVSDLVWGKVRSHPWWPGQIIDPSNASKKAMKYYKKDSFLVAYFGDHSFAWNNSSVLKPFRANFSQNEKQINTEIFKTAVDCALEEVSRRVELGLACSCVPKETYKTIEYQVIENAGIAKKSNKRHGNDESASVSSFEPDKLVDYVRLLAQFPAQCDKMDVAITKAQLSSYGQYKGYRELPEFLFCGDLLEDAPVHEEVEKIYKNGEKFKNNLIENANPNKVIILSNVTDDAPKSVGGTSKLVSSSGLKKRKARVSITNGSVKRPNRPLNKVVSAPVSTPKPSFKVGALIQRVASQLTGPVLKSGSDPKVDHSQHDDQIVQTPVNPQMEAPASVAEMLSQLHLTAQDPMKEYGFFQTIIPFFYERRAAVFSKSLKKSSTVEKPNSETKKKAPSENDPEEFEFDFDFDFDDVNDSYWTDRIIQNHSEDQPLQDTQNGAVVQYPVVEHEPDKPAKRRRRSNKKQKRVISHEHEPEPEPIAEEESEIVRKRRENLATEVVLKFEEGINFCSEIQLNKMFRRFGSLMESETEVDRDGGRARVVFKKCFDAEVAHDSAGRFNIFGSVNVSYELNYSPLVSYKPLPLPLPLLHEDQTDQI